MADGLLSNRGQSIFDLDRRSFLMAMDELGISGADRDNLLRRYREQASPFSGVYGASREAQEDIAARGRRPVAFGLLSTPAEATGWDAVRGLRPEFMSSALGLLEGVGKGIDAPASAGLIPASDAPMEALGTVGMAALGSTPARVPEGALRIFGGPWARTADLNALDRAKQMEAEGTDRGMIWGQTGWYRGGDGKWRFEIGDEATGLEPTAYRDLLRNYFASGEMGDLFRANDLYQAYPDLARIDTRIENTRGSAPSSGKYTPPMSRKYFGLFDITEKISARGGVEPGVSYGGRPARLERYLPQRSTLLHELQHAVQERENFARGTSPMYSSGVPREEAFAAYRAAPGEIEARNVQERADMPGLLRRMVAPWETADMPETQPPQFESVVASSNPIMRAPSGGITAWHGSPHIFKAERLVRMPDGSTQYLVGDVDRLPDVPPGAQVIEDFPMGRFRMSQIGTGEGAQAYGPGLYVAESRDVGQGYRDALAAPQRTFTLGGQPFDSSTLTGIEKFAYEAAANNPNKTAQQLDDMLFDSGLSDDALARAKPFLEKYAGQAGMYDTPQGRLYEVNIAANPEDFLDWDKPLSEQPQVVRDFANARWQQIFGRAPDPALEGEYIAKMASPQGGIDSSDWLLRGGPGDAQRERLREAGIPGVRYLDAGSRGAGDGTRNYVVFNEDLMRIVRVYGIAGAAAMLGMSTGEVEAAMRQAQGQSAPGLLNMPSDEELRLRLSTYLNE